MSEWISVKDELPEKYEHVFIFPRPEFQNELFVGELTNKDEFQIYYEDSCCSYTQTVTVTHWMQIPEDPV